MRRQRQIADFIEEQGAAGCGLEAPGAVLARIRERSFSMAEELTFQRRLGQAAHVDREKMLSGAARGLVDRPRHQFLADAILAEHHHIRLGRTDVGDEGAQLAH